MRHEVNIAIIGFGVVGSGTLELLKEHQREVQARVGAKVKIKWVGSRNRKHSRLIDKSIKQTVDWRDIVSDPEVDLVVELIGGTNPAKEIVLSALRSGKHVITANKAILSKHWNEIFLTARQRSKLVYFEAAVGGGVPIVQALNEGLAGNKIHKIVGILNGTSNFILTQMQEGGLTFEDALKAAQKAGFAEADPTYDIEGIDAAQKIAILGSLATGRWIHPSNVHTEGISRLQPLDIRLIEERLHSRIKLLAIAEESKKGWVFRVHPTMISQSHPFANVRNEYNAVSLHGNAVGDVMLSGKGAGRLPTSSAVVSDIMFLCRQIANGTAGRYPYVSSRDHDEMKLSHIGDAECRYYMRVNTVDKPGLLSKITGILGAHKVSIASVHQDSYEEYPSKRGVPIILLTHATLESNIQASVKAIDRLSTTLSKTVLIRME